MFLKNMITSIIAKRMSKKLKNSTIYEEDIIEVLREIRISLLDADVNLQVVKQFINSIKEKVVNQVVDNGVTPADFVLKVIKEELTNILGSVAKPININKKIIKIMLVGLQGSGKTTTIAKLANYFKNKHNKKPLVVACDIYRAAAIDQLRTLANDIKVDFYEKGTQNPYNTIIEATELAEQQNNDVIIVDTAGRLQTNVELMNELVEVKKALSPDEILLVVDAMAGQDITNVAKEFNEWLKLTGIIITKLDSDAKGGAALSLISLLNIPVKFTGDGEKVGSLDNFYPERMADRILGLGDVVTLAEKAIEDIDERQAKNTFQRMLAGKFDLEDLMRNMEQIAKMGSLGGIMKMLPNTSQFSEADIENAEESIRVWKVLLTSMTRKERRNPKLFKKQPNRKVRVTKGSGRSMDELNKLLKKWESGRDRMCEMGKQLQQGKNPFKTN